MADENDALLEAIRTDPERYGADPVKGNFTTSAEMHLWCANALAVVLSAPEHPVSNLDDDLQAALRHLLQCEIERGLKANAAGRHT